LVIINPVVVRNMLQKTHKPKHFDHKRNHNIREEIKTTNFGKNKITKINVYNRGNLTSSAFL